MKTINFQQLVGFLFLAGILLLTSCSYEVRPTSVKVEDPVRHYYPIPEGRELAVNYDLTNTGKSPLVISDIQTSCGCIAISERRYVIPPDTKVTLQFKFHSIKNIGLVKNSIFLFGNFSTGSLLVLEFDVHVVPPSDYTRDYEELYDRHRTLSLPRNGSELPSNEYPATYYVDSPEY